VVVVYGVYRAWKVMEFKIQIFLAWKVMESDPGPEKSWKINQMVATFLTGVHVPGVYVHYHCLLSDTIQCVSTTLSSNTVKLQLL